MLGLYFFQLLHVTGRTSNVSNVLVPLPSAPPHFIFSFISSFLFQFREREEKQWRLMVDRSGHLLPVSCLWRPPQLASHMGQPCSWCSCANFYIKLILYETCFVGEVVLTDPHCPFLAPSSTTCSLNKVACCGSHCSGFVFMVTGFSLNANFPPPIPMLPCLGLSGSPSLLQAVLPLNS